MGAGKGASFGAREGCCDEVGARGIAVGDVDEGLGTEGDHGCAVGIAEGRLNRPVGARVGSGVGRPTQNLVGTAVGIAVGFPMKSSTIIICFAAEYPSAGEMPLTHWTERTR